MVDFIKKIVIGLFVFIGLIACDDSSDFLNKFIENGPIIYSAKVDSIGSQSGLYRVKVVIRPGEDVNKSYCLLHWNITSEVRDSVKVYYTEDNYDADLNCYYTIIDVASDDIQGNLLIKAVNVDEFGNRSLTSEHGAYIYGSVYLSTLMNDGIYFSLDVDEITIERKVGSIGNFISYEQQDGTFTKEEYFTGLKYPLVNAKTGGVIRNKTKYLINKTDIDELEVTKYSETKIPAAPPRMVDFCTEPSNPSYAASYAFDGVVNHTSSSNMWHTGWEDNDHQKYHNNNSDPTLAHYYVIDYKDDFFMNSITVYNDAVAFLKTVDIWVSNDMEYISNTDKGSDRTLADYWRVPHENNWLKIGTLNFDKVEGSKTLELSSPEKFRLIMLTMPDSHNTGNGNIRISEIEVDADRVNPL